MYYDDHSPPHFHARYGSHRARIDIASLDVMTGRLSPRVRGLITEWASQHQAELLKDWEFARSGAPLNRIEPLS
jgi:hypothetical protein